MRKAQKKQAEGFVELLGQAHDEIKKAIEKKNIPAALSLLADCQDGAISLGELIEKTEGEDAPTISVLEEYCETLYRVHEELSQEQIIAGKVHKTLRQSLTEIKNSIKNEIKIRQEVVFLPYKASMWDSLESVWKAAEEDPDCDAYVIPIPYYDKNPDGSFREKHYEGDQYPYYVPVVRYEDYDFEKRMPDKIFIHNPYDEYNYVTSVEPFFYSSNLKKFTEQLVYIPYFILGEIDPEDQQAVDGMKHFCTQPGVINADRVIVQSEAMRQIYVNVLTAHMAGGGYKRKYWEERILGLGSPKVDKVLNTRKEDLAIPKEWLKVIQKPDGSFKKIIFYNTSVSALLKHNEKMLVKMRDVFSVFKENRDEVALLWRPHPLIKATISSMRPQLWAEYEKMVEEYKEEGWGIYDDTADMDRAVCLSDAYYGDGSSVVELCRKAHKPVMIQNVEIAEPVPERIPLWFLDAYIEDNKIWFASNDFNGLYVGDLISGEVQKAADFPDENKLLDYMYVGVHQREGKLYFIPSAAAKMSIYDMKKHSFEIVGIPLPQGVKEDFTDKFQCSLIYKNKLFLFGYDLCVFEYDMDSKEIKFCQQISKMIKAKVPAGKLFSSNYVLDEAVAFIVIRDTNVVVELNLENRNVKFHKVGEVGNQYLTIVKQDDNIWVAGINVIVCWNMHINKVEKIVGREKAAEAIYVGAKYADREILFFDGQDKRNAKIDVTNKRAVFWNSEKSRQSYNRGWNYLMPIRNISGADYYLDTGNYTLHYFKNEDYVQKYTIAKASLFEMIEHEDYYLSLQKHGGKEGGVSALASLELFLYGIIRHEIGHEVGMENQNENKLKYKMLMRDK